MFRFEHIEHLYLLGILPVLLLIFLFSIWMRKRTLRQFGDPGLIQKLMPEFSRYKRSLKFGILLTAFALLAIAWANPQWGSKKEKVKRKSSDIFIALDISQSMLAQDIRPNRMERAKQFTQQLIRKLQGDRIGLIFFAGDAFLQTPLTTDYSAIDLQLRSADPNMTSVQGTALAAAIEQAEKGFQTDSKNHRALIIITDGEDHEAGVMEKVRTATDDGLMIFTIGVGTRQGSDIPIYRNGKYEQKRDRNGKVVNTALNEDMLSKVADAGRGKYYNIVNGDQVIEALKSRIEKLEKQEFEQRTFSEYESYFQYFLAFALLLLVLEFIISYRKNRLLKGRDFFNI